MKIEKKNFENFIVNFAYKVEYDIEHEIFKYYDFMFTVRVYIYLIGQENPLCYIGEFDADLLNGEKDDVNPDLKIDDNLDNHEWIDEIDDQHNLKYIHLRFYDKFKYEPI